VFSNRLQNAYFDRWIAFISDCTLFLTDLVTQILPQLARAKPAIRHAAFAVGTAAIDSETQQLVPAGSSSHYTQAFAHYSRALRIIYFSKAKRDGTL